MAREWATMGYTNWSCADLSYGLKLWKLQTKHIHKICNFHVMEREMEVEVEIAA